MTHRNIYGLRVWILTIYNIFEHSNDRGGDDPRLVLLCIKHNVYHRVITNQKIYGLGVEISIINKIFEHWRCGNLLKLTLYTCIGRTFVTWWTELYMVKGWGSRPFTRYANIFQISGGCDPFRITLHFILCAL